MPVDLKVPSPGESITEVQIRAWLKSEGESVRMDEVVAEIDTDKASMELAAPVSGVLAKILAPAGADAAVGDVIALIEEGDSPLPPLSGAGKEAAADSEPPPDEAKRPDAPRVMPSARRVLGEAGISSAGVEGTGPGGRVLKEDALQALASKAGPERTPPADSAEAPSDSAPSREPADPPPATKPEASSRKARARPAPNPPAVIPGATPGRTEESVRMTSMRRVIAKNLVEAQQTAALLTTFNEIDMTAVIALRKCYRDLFLERHGVKLGFMSFFVRAAAEALRAVPAVNAKIEGSDIVYRNYQDIGIAVGGGRGLVVPILRNAETLGFAQIECAIADFGARAKRNKIELSELVGGTFTISNGGIYGSMLSTPIVNPPQSGVLGMHAIRDRPVAIDGKVVVRPIMYVALTYDHRIVDGREAVFFLKRIKELVESPERIWLEV